MNPRPFVVDQDSSENEKGEQSFGFKVRSSATLNIERPFDKIEN